MTVLTFILTFVGISAAFFLLALGYIVARKIIKGSCGSIDEMGIEKACKCKTPCFARRMRMKHEEAQKRRAEMNRDLGLEK
ncbi:MAG: (Na+)-NQR maturation NqrM [Succinivibrionaceae bacterium]